MRECAHQLTDTGEENIMEESEEDILGHLRKLVYENGSRKIDMRAEVINILAEYE